MSERRGALLKRALEADHLPAIESALRDDPSLLNPSDRRPPLAGARSLATAERLLSLGADPRKAGEWWSPGFYTRKVRQDVARLLVDRGAPLTPHAAAGLGFTDRLAAMLDVNPLLVHAKGGDGCTPLHFARDIETATLLLERGARIDARDEDHNSTPAQWLIGDAPEVVRFLLDRGATPDIFLAAALGDHGLAERLVQSDPACLSFRIGKAPEFPPLGYDGRGGTILQWTLAFNSYPHQIALLKGHDELFAWMYERTGTVTRFLVSCVLARRQEAEAIAAQNPGIVQRLPEADLQLPALYCWETNSNLEAVKLMLDLGFPVDHPERTHGYTALHNAAWEGAADLVDLLIARGAPVDLVDPGYNSTPLGFAIYDCVVEHRHPEGEFGRVAESLLAAGSPWEPLNYPVGDVGIDAAFERRLRQKPEGAALLGDAETMNRLLGANPAAEQLTRALAGAAKGGHAALCRDLLARGAPVNGKAGWRQSTPLMYAAASGSLETVELLLSSGADVKAKNVNDATALGIAIERGYDAIAKRLKDLEGAS